MPCVGIKLLSMLIGCIQSTVNGSMICDYSRASYINTIMVRQLYTKILGYTYAGMVQVSQTNARPLGYTCMAKISLNEL